MRIEARHAAAKGANLRSIVAVVLAAASFAAGAVQLQGGPRGTGQESPELEQREVPASTQAKNAYAAGLKAVKKAQDIEAAASANADPDRQARAKEKAADAYNRALEQFEIALANQPDLVEAWSYVGLANLRLGAYAEALDAYDHALARNPQLFQAVESRGEVYLGLNRIDDAKNAYEELLGNARGLSDELLGAMKRWIGERRSDARGVTPLQLDDFARWVAERGAKNTT